MSVHRTPRAGYLVLLLGKPTRWYARGPRGCLLLPPPRSSPTLFTTRALAESAILATLAAPAPPATKHRLGLRHEFQIVSVDCLDWTDDSALPPPSPAPPA